MFLVFGVGERCQIFFISESSACIANVCWSLVETRAYRPARNIFAGFACLESILFGQPRLPTRPTADLPPSAISRRYAALPKGHGPVHLIRRAGITVTIQTAAKEHGAGHALVPVLRDAVAAMRPVADTPAT
jgi:hypothetical protein